jgi:hypothetical protein
MASGGILLMWDRRVAEKIIVCGGIYCCLLIQKRKDGFSWDFVGVYDLDVDRRLLGRKWLASLVSGIFRGALERL